MIMYSVHAYWNKYNMRPSLWGLFKVTLSGCQPAQSSLVFDPTRPTHTHTHTSFIFIKVNRTRWREAFPLERTVLVVQYTITGSAIWILIYQNLYYTSVERGLDEHDEMRCPNMQPKPCRYYINRRHRSKSLRFPLKLRVY